MKKIRIMMAEDHHSARQAYLSVLSEENNFQIIGDAPNGFELLKLIEKRVPDIVLVDVEMPVMDGFRTISILKEKYPAIKPIVLSMHTESYFISQLILCGARAYLSKSCQMEELIESINRVYADGFYFSESLARVIVSSSFKDRKFQENLRHIALSEREIEVLRLVCAEKSNRQIADQLGIVPETVDYHRRNIYRKTKSSSLIALIKYAIKNGIMVV